jgi:6-bladed beta-propeller
VRRPDWDKRWEASVSVMPRIAGRIAVVLPTVLVLGCTESSVSDVLSALPRPESVVRATELVRIGRPEGDGPDVFGRVSFVSVDPLGRLYVGDGMTQAIHVFDSDGRPVRSFGRTGEGPGEFSEISGMTFDGAGNAWVWDPPQSRFSVYDSTGVFVKSVPRRWPTYAIPWPGRFSPDGLLLDVATELQGLEPQKRLTQRFHHAFRVIRLDTLMNRVDSAPPIGVDRTAFQGNFIVPFQGGVVAALEPDGSVWSTHGPRYRIIRTNVQGDTTLRLAVDAPPVPVGSAERDSVIASMHLPPNIPPMDPDLIPKDKPAVVRLVTLAPGWVGAFPELGGDTGRFLDVFAPDGKLRARIDLGTRLLLSRGAPSARGGLLYGVTTDELDVPYVVGFDLGVPELGH